MESREEILPDMTRLIYAADGRLVFPESVEVYGCDERAFECAKEPLDLIQAFVKTVHVLNRLAMRGYFTFIQPDRYVTRHGFRRTIPDDGQVIPNDLSDVNTDKPYRGNLSGFQNLYSSSL